MNVPFSHPSEVYPQKDGRKVRSRWKGTFTFRAPAGTDTADPHRASRIARLRVVTGGSRAGSEPISTRNSTDLDAEYDRSRRQREEATASPRRRTRTGASSASATTRSAHLPGSRAPIERSPRISAPWQDAA